MNSDLILAIALLILAIAALAGTIYYCLSRVLMDHYRANNTYTGEGDWDIYNVDPAILKAHKDAQMRAHFDSIGHA